MFKPNYMFKILINYLCILKSTSYNWPVRWSIVVALLFSFSLLMLISIFVEGIGRVGFNFY
jgi:hypothetical protein